MHRLSIVFALVAVACGAPLQTVQLVNLTPRPIEAVYVYPSGASDRGTSRAQLAPNARTTVQIRAGHVEVYAVSAKYQLDAHTRDRPSASGELELTGSAEVVFYDQDSRPAEVDRPGVFGVSFSPPPPTPSP